MLKMMKTTTMTTLVALILAGGLSTQANAQSANLISGTTVTQSTQFNSTNRIENRRSNNNDCLLYTSPSPRDLSTSRMPSSA